MTIEEYSNSYFYELKLNERVCIGLSKLLDAEGHKDKTYGIDIIEIFKFWKTTNCSANGFEIVWRNVMQKVNEKDKIEGGNLRVFNKAIKYQIRFKFHP